MDIASELLQYAMDLLQAFREVGWGDDRGVAKFLQVGRTFLTSGTFPSALVLSRVREMVTSIITKESARSSGQAPFSCESLTNNQTQRATTTTIPAIIWMYQYPATTATTALQHLLACRGSTLRQARPMTCTRALQHLLACRGPTLRQARVTAKLAEVRRRLATARGLQLPGSSSNRHPWL